MQGRVNHLNDDKLKLLQDIGFVWNCHATGNNNRDTTYNDTGMLPDLVEDFVVWSKTNKKSMSMTCCFIMLEHYLPQLRKSAKDTGARLARALALHLPQLIILHNSIVALVISTMIH